MNEVNENLVFSVSEITLHIKQILETQFDALYIRGEIGSFVHHSSGHMYFNLKDNNAVIKCAFFRSFNYQLDFTPNDGDEVICYGRISVFERSGQYQLIVQNMYTSGKGIWQEKFEQLKKKLFAEGLFNPEHKKPLPTYPDTIGIITSPTSAALQDMLNILKRRFPCQIIVYPSLMQGQEAPQQIISGLNYFNTQNNVDLIVIARGGGSQEDLFCFNDEHLARAIFNSKLPVVSAIGHEIDFTIADFVADLRAPTPSAAAELIVPDREELLQKLTNLYQHIRLAIKHNLTALHNKLRLKQLTLLQFNPEKKLQTYQQRLDEVVHTLLLSTKILDQYKQKFKYVQTKFFYLATATPREYISAKYYWLSEVKLRLSYSMEKVFSAYKQKVEILSTSLQEQSLQKQLNKGYSILRYQGKIIKSIHTIDLKKPHELILSDGFADITVNKVESKSE